MVPSSSELAHPASTRYGVAVIGGDAVFLVDKLFGHKLYVGLEKRQSRPDLRRYVSEVAHDLSDLSMDEFSTKYGLLR